MQDLTNNNDFDNIKRLAAKIDANTSYVYPTNDVFYFYDSQIANKIEKYAKEALEIMKKRFEEINEMFDAAELAGLAEGMKPISKEDYDRFWKWMMVPMKDVPDEELIWCSKQDRQNSIMSKNNWLYEIKRRGLKIE